MMLAAETVIAAAMSTIKRKKKIAFMMLMILETSNGQHLFTAMFAVFKLSVVRLGDAIVVDCHMLGLPRLFLFTP